MPDEAEVNLTTVGTNEMLAELFSRFPASVFIGAIADINPGKASHHIKVAYKADTYGIVGLMRIALIQEESKHTFRPSNMRD